MLVTSNKNILNNKYRIFKYNELDSTLSEAERLFQSGHKEDAVVIADSQKAGYGKLNRKWYSPKGNLYLTIIKKIDLPIADVPQISLIMSLAVIELLKKELSNKEHIRFKWPNDVLVDGKKISGVLLRGFSESSSDIISHLLIGVGLNVNHSPRDLSYQATSIKKESKNHSSVDYYLEELIIIFDQFFQKWQKEGFLFIRDVLEKCSYNFGENISVKQGDKKISGVFKKIDNNGNLVILGDNGGLKVISTGDVLLKNW